VLPVVRVPVLPVVRVLIGVSSVIAAGALPTTRSVGSGGIAPVGRAVSAWYQDR
jgi:hypothetical protein